MSNPAEEPDHHRRPTTTTTTNSNSETTLGEKAGERDTRAKEVVWAWTTWEELLLACAVKRHGVKDWDAVAMELQSRSSATSSPSLLTPQICRDRFLDLQRRFITTTSSGPSGDNKSGDVTPEEEDGVAVPWLEELRKLRMAELRQEVHRYDLSIQSLQMKVKRLEEEGERSLKDSEHRNDDVNHPDLEKDNNLKVNINKNIVNSIKEESERSETDKKKGGEKPPEVVAGKEPSGEDENQSVNESNSTGIRGTGAGSKTEPEPASVKPAGEDSCHDSSDRHNGGGKVRSEDRKVTDSGELRGGDSVDDSKEATATTKESSDVQSTASLTRKRRRGGHTRGNGRGVGGRGSGGGASGGDTAALGSIPASKSVEVKRELSGKSEPLASILDVIRAHKHGSIFERRLDIQKTEKYTDMIRQHVDLSTVQTRIDDGSYSSCSKKFYLDLLLLFSNAIVFFPKSSPESRAAHTLRSFVMKEFKNMNPSSDPVQESSSAKLQPKPEADRSESLLVKHKSTAPLVVCKKRSSIAAKASSSGSKAEKQADNKPLLNLKTPVKSSSSTPNEDDSPIKLKLKEKPVTGARSRRRNVKGRPGSNNPSQSNPSSNQNTSSSSQQAGSAQKGSEEPKAADKKKTELSSAAAKKRGAADFLKRIKKNSPAKGSLVEALKGSGDDSKAGGGKSDQQKKKKVEERKDAGPLRRSGNGNGGGRPVKDDNSPSKRSVGRPPKKGKEAPAAPKRGRDGGEGEGSTKRPAKRSRR